MYIKRSPSSVEEGWNNTEAILAWHNMSDVAQLAGVPPGELFWVHATNGWFQDPLLEGKSSRYR